MAAHETHAPASAISSDKDEKETGIDLKQVPSTAVGQQYRMVPFNDKRNHADEKFSVYRRAIQEVNEKD
jgi:hypothetical protein